MKTHLLSIAAACFIAGPLAAADVNVPALGQNGWFSDDTRADGTGTVLLSGTNLKSDTLTDAPENGSGVPGHNADILSQIVFGAAPGTVPALTYGGAVRLRVAPSVNAAKSQISHRKDDATGHGPGSAFGPAFTAQYSWMGNGTVSVTASLKFGIKTSEFGAMGVSSRTGENVWDKILIYEPGNGNGGTSDGFWHTETIDYTTGKWWFFDRTVGASSQTWPMSLSAMSTSTQVFSGAKTLADVYALITAGGAKITSVQFGIGSFNGGGSVYVNEFETSAYLSGATTTFGNSANVTPDTIFGGGNANGSFTVDRVNGVELGMRGKLRYPASNIYNSNGDGTYTFNTGTGGGPADNAEWSFEWSVNTNWNGSSSYLLDDLNYEIGMDWNPGAGTNYLRFDHITPGSNVPYTVPQTTTFWDHSIGTNATGNGAGVEAVDSPTYLALLAANNVAQNSWKPVFFTLPLNPFAAPFTFNPSVNGRYEFYLSAFDGAARVARTDITIFALDKVSLTLDGDGCQTVDQDLLTPGTQIKVTLNVRNPDSVSVTGYQVFLDFDDSAMTYVGATSSYSASPFTLHFQPAALAEVSAGKLRLDGATAFGASAILDDALLATLYFTVSSCSSSSVSFDLTQLFPSETSNVGIPYVTDLLDSPSIVSDTVAPVIGSHANITQASDAGTCGQAVVTYTAPTVTDTCDATPTLVCSPPSGSTFALGTTTVTCTATDDCGNQSQSTFTVTITNTVLIDVTVQLQGSGAATCCIFFKSNLCSSFVHTSLVFTGGPGTAVATIEVPCGLLTSICAKDQQHTQTAVSSLTDAGAKYMATSTLVLKAGDTDNDRDVDINDVTLLLAQFGTNPGTGGCPWDLVTKSADFSNNSNVGSEDYSAMSPNWLTISPLCSCTGPQEGDDEERPGERWVHVTDELTAAADLDRNGRVDVRDVEILEKRHGLSG